MLSYKFIGKSDKLMKAIFLLSSVFSVFALLSIIAFLLIKGFPPLADIGIFKFLFGTRWDTSGAEPVFGSLPLILGTIYVTILSTLFGVTLGLFTSVFMYKFCPKKVVPVIRQMLNLLAGIPSVIIGLFGMFVIVPFVRGFSPTGVGEGIFSASIILTIMVLPTITAVSLDALNSVPKEVYDGGLALGATKEQTVFRLSIPAAKSGIFAAVILSIGRAIGETMAVMMVIGGASARLPDSLFRSASTMTAAIADGFMEKAETQGAKIALGLILLFFVLILNISFSLIKNRRKK